MTATQKQIDYIQTLVKKMVDTAQHIAQSSTVPAENYELVGKFFERCDFANLSSKSASKLIDALKQKFTDVMGLLYVNAEIATELGVAELVTEMKAIVSNPSHLNIAKAAKAALDGAFIPKATAIVATEHLTAEMKAVVEYLANEGEDVSEYEWGSAWHARTDSMSRKVDLIAQDITHEAAQQFEQWSKQAGRHYTVESKWHRGDPYNTLFRYNLDIYLATHD